MIHPTADVSPEAKIGKDARIWHQAQVREGAVIGDNCIIGKNVYIDKSVCIGNNCKIQNNSSLYHGAKLEDGVFIGPHCILTNDKLPRAINAKGNVKEDNEWTEKKILIKEGASLGAGVIILPDIIIGKFAMIGAGSVVTKSIPDFGLAYGNPAKLQGYACRCGRKLEEGKEAGNDCYPCQNKLS